MHTATGLDDDGFVERIMRHRNVRRLDPLMPTWRVAQDDDWWEGDPYALEFRACRRRLLRYLLKGFPECSIEYPKAPTTLKMKLAQLGTNRWGISNEVSIRDLDDLLMLGEWKIWHGREPHVDIDQIAINPISLFRATQECGCAMCLIGYHDNDEWILVHNPH